ncbi:hypothetical protein ES708_15409 [subsurface metagenome]
MKNKVILSNKAKQFIYGELLGDGCLENISRSSSRFTYASKYLDYVKWLSSELNNFGLKQSGKIMQHDNNWGTYYQYKTKCYPELKEIRSKWYTNGKKIVPKDIKLTPLTCRQWYIGDGSLRHPIDAKPAIVLSTDNFTICNVELLVNKINILGLKATRYLSTNRIYIWANSTKIFLDYIGLCPVNCYKYKWAY